MVRKILTIPFVFVMELLNALMNLIPQRLWNRLWRNVTTAAAGGVDTSIRLVLVAGIVVSLMLVAYLW